MSNPNDACNDLRRAVWWAQNRPPEPPTLLEECMISALALIDLGREALDFNASPAVAFSKRRAFMERTNPAVLPVVLGGDGAPPASPGDAP